MHVHTYLHIIYPFILPSTKIVSHSQHLTNPFFPDIYLAATREGARRRPYVVLAQCNERNEAPAEGDWQLGEGGAEREGGRTPGPRERG